MPHPWDTDTKNEGFVVGSVNKKAKPEKPMDAPGADFKHKNLEGSKNAIPPSSGRHGAHEAAGQEYYTLWRQGADAPMGLYCRTREQAKGFLLQLPDKLRVQLDIVKVKVIG